MFAQMEKCWLGKPFPRLLSINSNITVVSLRYMHANMLIKDFSGVFALKKRKIACKRRKAGMISHFLEIYPSIQYHNRICKQKYTGIVSVACLEPNKGRFLSNEKKRA